MAPSDISPGEGSSFDDSGSSDLMEELVGIIEEGGFTEKVKSKTFRLWLINEIQRETGAPKLLLRLLYPLLVKAVSFIESGVKNKAAGEIKGISRKFLDTKLFREKICPALRKISVSGYREDSVKSALPDFRSDLEEYKDWAQNSTELLSGLEQGIAELLAHYADSQPHLLLDIEESNEPINYEELDWLISSTRGVDFVGRTSELKALDDFANDEKSFSLWVVTGPSGSGKTRLAIEWMLKNRYENFGGWQTGFVSRGQAWETFVPYAPTFIVVDYFHIERDAVKTIIERCRGLEAQNKLLFPVRLLILDHRFDFSSLLDDGFWSHIVGSRSEQSGLKNRLFCEQALSLAESSDTLAMLSEIVANVSGKSETSAEVTAGMNWLQSTAGAAQPLFAALVGLSLRKGEAVGAISRRGLMQTTLEGSRRLPWRTKGQEKTGVMAGGYVCLSTMLGGTTRDSLKKTLTSDEQSHLPGWGDEALSLARYITAQGDGKSSDLIPLLPDILGETFVLLFFEPENFIGEDKKTHLLKALFSDEAIDDVFGLMEFCRRCTLNLNNDQTEDANEWKETWLWLLTLLPSEGHEIHDLNSLALISASNAAASLGNHEQAKALIAKAKLGATENEALNLFFDVLRLQAYHNGNISYVKQSIELGLDLSSSLFTGSFPLLVAAEAGHEEIVARLLDKNAEVNKIHDSGTFPLLQAAQQGHDKIVARLLNKSAEVNQISKENGAFPLLMAAQEGHEKVVALLLGKNADVNKVNENSGTFPLFMAAQEGHDKVVARLLDKDADVNKVNEKHGTFPLLMAAQQGHEKVVALLLDKDAEVNKTHDDSGFPLLVAAQNGHEKVVARLLDKGAEVNKTHDNGTFPLLMAAQNGHEKVVALLLDKDAEVNKTHDNGAFPLLMAAQNGHEKVVAHLLDKGAEVNQTVPGHGFTFTALDSARHKGHDLIVERLVKAGARD